MLDTERTRLSTQDSLAAAQADRVSDHLRLYKALGGGWNPDSLDTPAPSETPPASGLTP